MAALSSAQLPNQWHRNDPALRPIGEALRHCGPLGRHWAGGCGPTIMDSDDLGSPVCLKLPGPAKSFVSKMRDFTFTSFRAGGQSGLSAIVTMISRSRTNMRGLAAGHASDATVSQLIDFVVSGSNSEVSGAHLLRPLTKFGRWLILVCLW